MHSLFLSTSALTSNWIFTRRGEWERGGGGREGLLGGWLCKGTSIFRFYFNLLFFYCPYTLAVRCGMVSGIKPI